ncbi:MAG: dienelactone hydrolase family protein [Chitinophagaceae bacterium]
MKKLLLIAVLAFSTALLFSYTSKKEAPKPLTPECYVSCFNVETREMISLDALKPGFAALHPKPLNYKLENQKGKVIEFTAANGSTAKGYFIKSRNKSDKWLFVIQEWWGLNDHIKREADKFYGDLDNVNVLAIDMYDGKIATTPDSAMLYMSSAKKERLETIVNAAIAYAGKKAEIYTVGWCFGGGWSLQSTILAGKQAKGCVMYYGRPETDIARLKTINCDVIGFFGNQDKGISQEVVNNFENNMKTAGIKLNLYRFEAGHGFANPSNPSFNKEYTEKAYQLAIAFLKARM